MIATRTAIAGNASGSFGTIPMLFPFIDEVEVFRDGALAILRSREYRLERRDARGATVLPRIPFAWRAIPDSAKVRIADSINGERMATHQEMIDRWVQDSAAGRLRTVTQNVMVDSVIVTRQVPQPRPRAPQLAAVGEIPDFMPPTTQPALWADADNNIWIRTVGSAPAGESPPTFDVVDATGRLVDCVRLPIGTTLLGFLPGRAVVGRRDTGRWQLDVARIRR